MGKFKFAVADWCALVSGPSVCRVAAEMGLDGVELSFTDFSRNLPLTDPTIRRYYLDAQQQYGVEFCAMAVNALDQEFAMPPENEQRAEERRFVLKSAVDTAAALNIPILQVPHFFANAIHNAEEMKMAAGFFREACEAAEKHGIIISCENPMNAQDNLALYELVNRPNFRLYFDNENPVFFAGENSAEMLRALGKHVCQIHVKDGTEDQLSCRHLGEGNAFFHECAEVVHEIGYEGWIVLENNYDMPPFNTFENDRFELLRRDVQIMKKAFSQA